MLNLVADLVTTLKYVRARPASGFCGRNDNLQIDASAIRDGCCWVHIAERFEHLGFAALAEEHER